MRILLFILGSMAVAIAAIFALSYWLTHVPAIDADDGDLAAASEAWFAARHHRPLPQFNGAAIVIKDGETIVRGAWGNDGEGRPLTPRSQFRLASVSKSFTAAAVLKLADDGLIDLDQPVIDQIPLCLVKATPAQLIRHVSGLPDNYLDKADPEEITTVKAVFDDVCARSIRYSAPGEFSYNNTGYVFLAGLVERISGRSFEAYLGEEILAPLGMTDTRVWNLVSEDDFAERAISFDTSGPLYPTNVDGVAGDGAVFSTVDDLANWARFWRDDRLISAALKDRATGRGLGDDYHFGLNRSGERVEHTGGWLGARTYFGFADSGVDGDVVIVLDNGSSRYSREIVDAVWTALE